MERVVHNPVDLVVEVPRPVVIEKTIEVDVCHGTSTDLKPSNVLLSCYWIYWVPGCSWQVPKIQIEERTIKVPKASNEKAKGMSGLKAKGLADESGCMLLPFFVADVCASGSLYFDFDEHACRKIVQGCRKLYMLPGFI